ncbi:MAG TPA: mechanosensitive ion channel family protein [Pseudonocardiaceae bacterium]|nr:mechanosensitive ion channel family protein [Pseudonocardiaceae bacterium]
MIGDLLTNPPACASDAGSWCYEVYQTTKVSWLAESANWLVAKPLKIIIILVFALVARFLAQRLIDRMTRDRGKAPSILRPLRERSPSTLGPLMSERRSQRAKTIGSVLKSIVALCIWGIACIWILGEFGFNLTPIIASAGVVGVAVGFGAQNLVKDFLSGIFMLLEDQYGVGDVIDVGSTSGTVEAVGLRVTTLRDSSGTVWYVRNGGISKVGNSSQGFAVAVVDVPLNYVSDIDRALEVLERSANRATSVEPLSEYVIEEPKVLGVQSLSSEGAILRVTVKVRPAKQWATQRELRREMMAAFVAEGLEVPQTTNGS